jgi:hypothetical protein
VSETTGPVSDPNPTQVNEPLQLADQQPMPPTPLAPQSHTSHTRTILEVVGVAVAGFLILAAAGVGFAVGHATGGVDRGPPPQRA